jgi:hypothetical protein
MATTKKTEGDDLSTALSSTLDEAFQGHEAYGEKPPEDRLSRTRESREGDPIHEHYDDVWLPTGSLDTKNLPPRPGFAQRWVRTKLGALDDAKNVMKRQNQGFRPRKADTVPKGVYVATINSRQYGDIIGQDGIILMERPDHLEKRHAAHNRAMAARQEEAVSQMLHRAQEPGKGFGPVRVDTRSEVSTGHRPAPVADD